MLEIVQVSDIFGAAVEDAKSFAVTCFDPDASIESGFWHWVVDDIPLEIAALGTGARTQKNVMLTERAKHLKNDAGLFGYLDSGPSSGHCPHRYIFAVQSVKCRNTADQ